MRSRRPIVAGLVVGLTVAALQLYGTLEIFELAIYDRLFEMRGPRPPRAPIVIVAIDEATLVKEKEWPFPRAIHGKLIERLAEGRPVAIGFDILFDQPSRLGPDDDTALGEAVRRAGNVVLASVGISEGADVEGGPPGVQLSLLRSGLSLPLPVIRQHAAAVALVNMPQGDDGRIRSALLRLPPGFGIPGTTFCAAIYETVAKAGLRVRPLPPDDEFLINFRGGPHTFRWVSYHQVVRGDVAPETFAGSIVLVGVTTRALPDMVSTPFARGGGMPGVEIHANTVDTLIAGNYIRAVPRAVAAVASLACALLVGWLVTRTPSRAVVGAGALLFLVWGVSYGAFSLLNVWFRVVGPSAAIVLALIVAIVASTSRRSAAGPTSALIALLALSTGQAFAQSKVPAPQCGGPIEVRPVYTDHRWGYPTQEWCLASKPNLGPDSIPTCVPEYHGVSAPIVPWWRP